MLNRRKSRRTQVVAGAWIILDDASIIKCSVRDLTSAGAGIVAAKATNLPDQFDLTFDGARSTRHCRVAWRALSNFGVIFLARDNIV